MTLKGKDAAHFLLGYLAALTQLRRRPSKRLLAMANEARDVLEGGSFHGPMAVWDMEAYANQLAQRSAERVKA